MAKNENGEIKTVLGNPEWYFYKDKPSFKLFTAGVLGVTALAGLAFYGIAVPLIAGLFPPTMTYLKYLTWGAAVGIPALTILSSPKRLWRAFKARIWGWYKKLFQPSKREQLSLNIELVKEKVRFLVGIASQMNELYKKWDILRVKYLNQFDKIKEDISRLKNFIASNESNKDGKIQLNLLKAKKELILIYNKAEATHGFVKDIEEKVNSLHERLNQAEEVRDRESYELEILQGKYELLIAQSELGMEAEETQKKLHVLSAGGLDTELFRDVNETGLIGETEEKLALLDLTLNRISVSPSDLGYGDMETQLNMGEARSTEYMEPN